jgi:PIN domain nuclease of toxin-antitoxin system
VKIFVDAKCFLWSFLDQSKLSDMAKEILSARHEELFFSAASSWEIAIKAGIGKAAAAGAARGLRSPAYRPGRDDAALHFPLARATRPRPAVHP